MEERSAYLKKTVVDLPFVGGLDQNVDAIIAEPPVLSIAQNVRYNKQGQLARRNGWRELPLTSLPSLAERQKRSPLAFTHLGQLVLQTHLGAYAYSIPGGRWYKKTDDSIPPFEYVNYTSVRNTWRSRNYDNAVANGFVFTVWEQEFVSEDTRIGDAQGGQSGSRVVSSNCFYQVREAATGAVVVPPTVLPQFERAPQVVLSDERYVVFAGLGQNLGDQSILFYFLDSQDTTIASLSTPVGVRIIQVANQDIKHFDMTLDNQGNGDVWVAYAVDGDILLRSADVPSNSFGPIIGVASSIDDDLPVAVHNTGETSGPEIGVIFDHNVYYFDNTGSSTGVDQWKPLAKGTQPTTSGAGKLLRCTICRAPDGRWFVAESEAVYDTTFPTATTATGVTSSYRTGPAAYSQNFTQWNISDTSGNFTTGNNKQFFGYLVAGHAFWSGDAYEFNLPLQAQLGAYYRGPNIPPDGGLNVNGTLNTTAFLPHCLLAQPTIAVNGRPRVLAIFHHDRAEDLYGDRFFTDTAATDGDEGFDFFKYNQHWLFHNGHTAVWTPPDGSPTQFLFTREVRFNTGGLSQLVTRDRFGGTTVRTGDPLKTSQMGGDEGRFIPEGYNNRVVSYGNLVLSACGVLGAYDGRNSFESSILGSPETPIARLPVETNGGTDAPTSGAIGYQAIYVWSWRDHRGQLHRSMPSPPSDCVPLGAGRGNDWRIYFEKPPLPLGVVATQAEEIKLQLEMYVSGEVAGGPSGSSDYDTTFKLAWRGDAIGDDQPNFGFQEVRTDPAYGRTARASAPVLYTTGGVFASEPPPSFTDITVAKNRVFGISAENRLDIWYTKSQEPDIAPEWNAALRTRTPEAGGLCVALANLNDRVIILKDRAIYYVVGEGPSNTGQGNQFSIPKPISLQIGCTNKNSVVDGVFGVMFQSQAGIFQLTPALELRLLRSAEDLLFGDDARITHAVNIPRESVVVFFKDNSLAAVYNYHFDKWSTDTNYDIVDTGNRHATEWNQNMVWTSSDWQPHEMRPTDWSDAGQSTTRPPMIARTSWVKLAGLGGFQRVWEYSAFVTPQDGDAEFSVSLERDFVAGPYQTDEFRQVDGDFSIIDGVGTVSKWVTRQRCRAIRLTLTDTTNVATSPGCTISGISLSAGVKGDLAPGTPVGSGN